MLDKNRNYDGIKPKKSFVEPVGKNGSNFKNETFFEISPVGFTRRSRVYRRDAIRFQGLDAILGGWMNWLCGTDSLDHMW